MCKRLRLPSILYVAMDIKMDNAILAIFLAFQCVSQSFQRTRSHNFECWRIPGVVLRFRESIEDSSRDQPIRNVLLRAWSSGYCKQVVLCIRIRIMFLVSMLLGGSNTGSGKRIGKSFLIVPFSMCPKSATSPLTARILN